MVVEDLLSSLMDKSLQLDNERKKFNVEKYTMVSELQQYRQLFEATAEENTKLNARLRDLTSMEGIFREELREKEERLKAAQEQASGSSNSHFGLRVRFSISRSPFVLIISRL
jgi:chromosome segregation ATPase